MSPDTVTSRVRDKINPLEKPCFKQHTVTKCASGKASKVGSETSDVFSHLLGNRNFEHGDGQEEKAKLMPTQCLAWSLDACEAT